MLRGAGPTLASPGVAGALSQPVLTLDRAAGGTPSADCALLATLAPGSYTARVSGVGGTTGLGLVEVHVLP